MPVIQDLVGNGILWLLRTLQAASCIHPRKDSDTNSFRNLSEKRSVIGRCRGGGSDTLSQGQWCATGCGCGRKKNLLNINTKRVQNPTTPLVWPSRKTEKGEKRDGRGGEELWHSSSEEFTQTIKQKHTLNSSSTAHPLPLSPSSLRTDGSLLYCVSSFPSQILPSLPAAAHHVPGMQLLAALLWNRVVREFRWHHFPSHRQGASAKMPHDAGGLVAVAIPSLLP
jgi:hypothetical protein